MAMWTRL